MTIHQNALVGAENPTAATNIAQQALYDRNFALVLACQMCFVIANTLMAHYSRWIEFLGGSLQQVGLIQGLGAVVGILLRPWLAQWINRIGARKTWAAGTLVFASGACGNLLLDNVESVIYVLRAVLFLGAAIVFASSLTYVSQDCPEARRTEAIGILGVGGFLGMLIGPYLGDLFLGNAVRTRAGFENLFLAATLVDLLPLGALFFLRAPEVALRPGAVRIRDFQHAVQSYWPGAIVLIDFVFGMCMTVPFVFVASFVDHFQIKLGDLSVVGLFFIAYSSIAIFLRIATRQLPDRIGPRAVMMMGMIFMAAGMLSFVGVGQLRPQMILLPAALLGIGHSYVYHTMTSLTIAPFPSSLRGTGSALALMSLDLGMLTGGPTLAYIAQHFGFNSLFATLAGICMISTVIYGISDRRRTKQSATNARTQ